MSGRGHGRSGGLSRPSRSVPLAQKQAGWSRLQQTSLALSDAEAAEMVQRVPE